MSQLLTPENVLSRSMLRLNFCSFFFLKRTNLSQFQTIYKINSIAKEESEDSYKVG